MRFARSRFSVRLVCAFVALACHALSAQAENRYGFPIIKTFGADEIGPVVTGYGYCAIQGSDGVLYVGGDGLLAFDGERWTSTRVPGMDGIYGLDFGQDGRIWAAAEGEVGWFARTGLGTWQFHSLRPFIPPESAVHGQVWSILAEGNGAVFVTMERAYRWDGNKVTSWPFAEPHSRYLSRFRGEVCVLDRTAGLLRVRPSGIEPVPPTELGVNEPCVVEWCDPQGDRLIIRTAQSFALISGGRRTDFPASTAQLLRDGFVLQVETLPRGRFAFNCWKLGIVVTDSRGNVEETLREADGIPGYVHRMFTDQDGELWLFSHVGIRRLDLDPNLRVFDERAGLPPTLYREIGSSNGVVALATAEGSWILNADQRTFSRARAASGTHMLGAVPSGLLISETASLWLAEPNQTTKLGQLKNTPQVAIQSSVHPGEILAGIYDQSIVAVVKSQPTRAVVEHLPVVAGSLAEDTDGVLWIGTETHGLWQARLNPSQSTTATLPDAAWNLPPITGPAFVRRTPQGGILVFGDAGAWVKPSGAKAFSPVTGYPTRPFAAVSESLPDGSFWVVHGATGPYSPCVAVVSPQGGWHWTPHSIPGLETIGPPRGIATDIDANGNPVLWIGGGKSVLRQVVADGPQAPRPGAPLLWGYIRTRRGERRPITAAIPYSTHAIEFDLAEPEFAQRGSIHLQTRIDGVDPDWVTASKDSRREFTAIRDGEYAMHVRAVAETGAVSEPTVFTFTVLPPWWRTRTALWVELVALAAIGYGGVQWRVRTLRRRNELLERKVKERTEELAEASAAKTQFVANMSHDIRNPLNGIVGLTLALEDTPLDGQQRELVATLRECTSYLSSLVDDVLDFASIEAGRIELRPGPFVPSELLNSVATALKAECASRGALLTIETDPEIPAVLLGDAGRVQQILINYVSNALKYAGGHIRLSASISPAAPGEIEFAVNDEGPGITSAEQTTLFSKFARLDSARRSNVPGTGLGLASCRLLADAMGGSVGVESQPGRGSRFFLRLPLVEASAPVTAPDNLQIPTTSVLLVEDTDYNALAAKAVLAKLGLSCDRAANGAEALRLFAEKRHHIVLLDRNLPDMDGTEVAAKIREIESDGLHTVMLAVTAYCTAEDRKRCLDAGMDAFVGKPLTPEKLRKVLLGAANQIVGSGAVVTTAPTTPAATPSIKPDMTLLEYLAEGTEGGVALQVDRFIGELHAAHDDLVATSQTNLPSVGDAAHRVLGHARMVSAARLAETLIALETAARKSDPETVASLLPAVAAEVEALTAALLRRPGAQTA